MENPFQVAELQRIIPTLSLLGAGTATLVLDLFLGGWRVEKNDPDRGSTKGKWLLYVISLIGVGIACWGLSINANKGGAIIFNGALHVDDFSNFMTALILVGTFLGCLTTIGPLRNMKVECGEYFALLLFSAAAMILLVQSNSLIMIFLSLETFSMAIYLLSAFTRDERRSVEGALKYFVLGGLASGFLLLGFAFIFGASGTIRLNEIASMLGTGAGVDPPLFLAGLGLSLVGFGFKVGAFPFHSWIPDAYEGAPSTVTGFMSVTVKAAGIAALLRIALTVTNTPELRGPMLEVVWWSALLTLVFANLVALVQSSVKRMLAYSAISHTGYLFIGLVAVLTPGASQDSSSGSPLLFYLLPYTLMTFGSFAILSCLGRESKEGETFDSFRGLSQRRPLLAFCMLIFMVSLAGIPPTAGFWGKLYLFRDAIQAGHWPLALVGILASIVSVYYYIRLVVVMYMKPPQEVGGAYSNSTVHWGSAMAISVAAAAVIAIGISPDYFIAQSKLSIQSISTSLNVIGK